MADTDNIEFQAEQAGIDWVLNSAVHGITFPGVSVLHSEEDDADNRTLPCFIFEATRQREHPPGSGCYVVNLTIALLAQADETSRQQLKTLWGNLSAVFGWDELAERLSDLEDFHCYGVVLDQPSDRQVIDRHWQKVLTVSLFCMAMDNGPEQSSSSSTSSHSSSESSASSVSSQSSSSS